MQTDNSSSNNEGNFADAKAHLQKGSQEAAEAAKSASATICNKGSELQDQVKEQIQEYSGHFSEYVKKCPMKAIGMAALAGVVLGMVVLR